MSFIHAAIAATTALSATLLVSPAPASPPQPEAGLASVTQAISVDRQSGADRYATAAALSRSWRPGVDRLFIASGQEFANAMVASARAGVFDAPVLLTRSDSVPLATSEAIARLEPRNIVIVGGTSSVTSSVGDQLARQSSATVSRINGIDQYDTAANAAKQYASGGDSVVLVNGESFPDALGASGLAAAGHAPLLMTRSGELPPVTRKQLDRLAPSTILVVGGSGVVSDSVANAAASYSTTGRFERISGVDRYATSTAVSGQFPTSVDSAYVASGQNYPDALAASAAAARHNVPVVITRRDSLPRTSREALERLTINRATVAGGTAVVSDAVMEELRQLGSSTSPRPGATFRAGSYNGMHTGDDAEFEDLVDFAGMTAGSSYYNVGQVGANNWPKQQDLQRLRDGKVVLMGMASKNWKNGGPTSFMTWESVGRGAHDAEIRRWARRLGQLDREIWFAWDIEPDVKLTQGHVPKSWSPEQFSAAARRISTIMAEEAPKVKFTFWVGGTQKRLIERMYPGDDYVDIICWDPYLHAGRSPDTTPTQLWSEFASWLDTRSWGQGKSIGLCETGFHNGHPDAKGAAFWQKAPAAVEALDLSFVFYFHRNTGPNGDYIMVAHPRSAKAYGQAMSALVP